MEQEAYDSTKAGWPGIAAKSRSYCDEVAKVSGGLYTILKGCLDMEADAAGDIPEFKF